MVAFIEDVYPGDKAEASENAFSTPPEIDEQSCSIIVEALEAAKIHLDKSSKCLIKCYSSAASSNKQFINLRLMLTELAIVFTNLHLPFATKVVTDLKEAIMLYSQYDVKKFKKNIRGIAKSTSEQAESAALLKKTYRLLLADLYRLHNHMDKKVFSIEADAAMKRNDASDARKVAKRKKERCDAERKKYDAEKENYDARADFMEKVKVTAEFAGKTGFTAGAVSLAGAGAALAAGTVLAAAGPALLGGAVACAVMGVGGLVGQNIAQDLEEEATTNGKIATRNGERAATDGENALTEGESAANKANQEASECVKAVKLIKEDMIDSLTQFTKAMEQVSEFLSSLASDTKSYAEKVETEKNTRRRSTSMAEHLDLIKQFGKQIISACDMFVRFEILVQARCDSLPVLEDADATVTDCTKNWCVKHKASGELQQHELLFIQLLRGVSIEIPFEKKQGKILRVLTKIWRPMKSLNLDQ